MQLETCTRATPVTLVHPENDICNSDMIMIIIITVIVDDDGNTATDNEYKER